MSYEELYISYRLKLARNCVLKCVTFYHLLKELAWHQWIWRILNYMVQLSLSEIRMIYNKLGWHSDDDVLGRNLIQTQHRLIDAPSTQIYATDYIHSNRVTILYDQSVEPHSMRITMQVAARGANNRPVE